MPCGRRTVQPIGRVRPDPRAFLSDREAPPLKLADKAIDALKRTLPASGESPCETPILCASAARCAAPRYIWKLQA